ncbi:gag-pol [Trichonephila clavipes]|nr:gag-pol [Trichonephila clavipes]
MDEGDKEIEDLMGLNFRTGGDIASRVGCCEPGHLRKTEKESAEVNGNVPSRRPCPENSKYCSRIKKKFGIIDQVVHQVTIPSISALDPWSDENVQKDQLADPEIKSIIEFKESSDEKPSWQDITPFHPTTKHYCALWDSFHLRNSVLY